MATTIINGNSSGSGTGYDVLVNNGVSTVTITALTGTFEFSNPVNFRMNLVIPTDAANITLQNSTFNRQVDVFCKFSNQIVTFDNINSYSDPLEDFGINIIPEINTSPRIFFKQTQFYVTSFNGPYKANGARTIFPVSFPSYIYLAYENDTTSLNNFTYTLNNADMFSKCIIQVGIQNPDPEWPPVVVRINPDDGVTSICNKLQIVGDVTITGTSFMRQVNVTVSAGKTLTFNKCVLSEYHAPATEDTTLPGAQYDPYILSYTGPGMITFNNQSIIIPRITQSKQINNEAIINFVAGNLNKVTSNSTVLIRHKPSNYDDYDSLYNNTPYVKSATIDVATGSYVFGQAGTDPVTFDMNFAANDKVIVTTDADGVESTNTTSAIAYVVLNVDGGNITYANNTTLVGGGISWNGYVIGRNNQVGGRSYVFNTSNQLDISGGLIITANAGNNILNPSATQGTWTGETLFSYYPSTSVDYSYNLMLDHPLIVGTGASPLAIPLYNGSGTYWYNFYADNTYRPNFYFGKNDDARFDLSAGTTWYVNFKNADFEKGVDVSLGDNENITSYSSTYRVPSASGSSCITLSGTALGSFTLNFDASNEQNDLYLNDDLNIVFNNQSGGSVMTYYNRFHFAEGEWDFNAAGLTIYKSYISTSNTGANDRTGRKGTICLDGSYTFANISAFNGAAAGLELNFLSEGTSTISNTTFTQTIYVWGSENLTLTSNNFQGSTTAIYNLNPANVTESSVTGNELVNLDSTNGVFTGILYLNGTNKFYLPHGKKCISPFNAVAANEEALSNLTQVILTSYRYSYFIDSELEPLAYYLATVYLDNAPSSDVTVFGSNDELAVNKEFTVRTTGTTADQYLTGRFSRLNVETLSTQKVILGYPLLLIGRNTQSNLKVLYVDGSVDTYALDLVGGSSAEINIENVTFNNPGSFAYFHVGSSATERIDFTSTSIVFNNNEEINTKHVGYLESVGSEAVLDLGNLGNDEVPNSSGGVLYNQFFWPTLGGATNSRPLISTQGYVAESWTNDPEYYDPESNNPTMYFQNVTDGLSKPNSGYGLGSWDAADNEYNDLYFTVAFGLDGTNSFEVSLNHVANFETYVAGAIFDNNTSGIKTKSYAGTQYKQTIRLRFKDDFTNLAQNSRLVTATFAQGGSDLWNVTPVPLNYYIDSQVSVSNYTLTTEYSTNGGSSWAVPNDDNLKILVSDSYANGTGNVHFVYKNGSNVLRFLYDSSLSFTVDISFVAVGPSTTDLNDYILSWPALQTSSNTLELRPLAYAGAWTQKQVNVTNETTEDNTAFNVFNTNDDTYLLVSTTSTFTGVNTSIYADVGNANYNINTNKYTFSVDFYMMTHILPPVGTGFGPLELDTSAFIDGTEIYPSVTIDVSSSQTNLITSSDVATPVNVSFSIDNSTLLSANSSFTVTLILDDYRNKTNEPPIPNPINYPVTVTVEFYIPLYVYLNTSDSRYNQDINAGISKGNTNDLYVYLNTKLNDDYIINFTLTGDNIDKNFSTTISEGDISASGSFQIAEDYKIWGDAGLILEADVDLVNTVNYSYVEAGTHEVRVLFGRAIGVDGYESSGSDLSKLTYSIQAATGDEHVRTPLDWNQGDAAGAAFDINTTGDFNGYVPITKYTPYFVEVEVASKGFYSYDVNSNLPPTFTVRLKDHLGTYLDPATDYIVNNNLESINANVNGNVNTEMTDLIGDSLVNKRVYFKLNPTTQLQGDTISVHIDFNRVDIQSNYDNLDGNSYHVVNIDFTGTDPDTGNMTSTAFFDTAGIRVNTWSILPSGDGKYLEFYHDSQSSHYITRLGLDANFHAWEA